MACVDEELQKPNFKHFCRVCKKGFMCGRALGGHMRAHGIGDESANIVDDDDDEVSDWEDKYGGSDHKRMYQLRANPNRLKSTKVCENCGKEFLSWKSFLEHGKYCCSDDGDDDQSLVSSPGSDGDEYDIGERKGYGWSKRKRSLRTKVGSFTSTYNNNTYSSEQEDLLLAKWLIDLANARVDPLTVEPEESCTSASKEEERRNPMMAYLSTSRLLNRDRDLEHRRKSDMFILPSLDKAKRPPKGLFECKACKKVFNSHQALGGHRASHKKVKGCYAAKQDQLDDNDVITHGDNHLEGSKSSSYYQFQQGSSLVGASKRKSKVHECSICHRVFSTGQALGGHKRCHWITSNSQDSSIFTPKFHFHNPLEQINESSTLEKQDPLDLNINPPDEDMSRIRQEPWNISNPFEVSTDIHLHPWSSTNSDHTKKENKDDVVYHNSSEHPREENKDDNFKNHDNNNNNNNNNSTDKNNGVRQDNATEIINVEDDEEADSKLKLAKLSDLNDINTISGNPSQWLQVGIDPTNEVGADS